MRYSSSAVLSFKRLVLGAAAMGSSAALALPASADTFDFSFVAPLTNGDVASGSGRVKTDQVDTTGRYLIRSAQGTFIGYKGQPTPYSISGATGYQPVFVFNNGFLVSDASGALSTTGIAFFDRFAFNGISFAQRADGKYDGVFTEVGVRGATLTFSPAASGVPEPATWAMLIVGFGMIGCSGRRAVRRSETRFDAKIKRITAGLKA